MIPLKLQIKNFLSYGPHTQTIDFTNHRLICLSGKNGHGKSALLDALTWAVWGQARKIGATAKPDQGVLRLGEVEMTVCFDFQFGGEKYRVRRDFSKKYGKPTTHLEFGILKEDDYFVSLTDKTLRKTQTKIEQTLGIDYETFTNSSFLRQGSANEFSKKSAKERKVVLSTILGLHQYDKAKQLVMENIRTLTSEKQHLEKLKELNQQEAELLKTVPEEQDVTEKKIAELEKETKKLSHKKSEWEQQKQQLQTEKEKYKVIAATVQQRAIEQKKHRTHLDTVVSQWKETHKLILALPDQAALEKEQKALTAAVTAQQTALQKSLKAKEALLTHKETLTKLTAALEKEQLVKQQTEKITLERINTEHKAYEKQKQELFTEQKTTEKVLRATQEAIVKLRKTIAPELLVSDLEEQQKLFDRHKALYQKWVEQGNWVNAHLKELSQKQQLANRTDNPSCPLCEQNLSQARKRFLQKKFSDQSQNLVHRFTRLKSSIEKLKNYLKNLHKNLEQLKEVELLLKQKQELSTKQATNNKTTEALEKAITQTKKEQEAAQKKLETLEKESTTALAQNKEFCELTKTVQTFEKELLAINYDGHLHKKLATELETVTQRLQQCQQLPHYKATQNERQTTVHTLCSTLKMLEKEQIAAQKLLKEEATLTDKEKTLQADGTALEKVVTRLSEEKEQLLQKKGTLAAQEKKRQELEKIQKEQDKKFKASITELHDLQQIAIALGKDGIQALLIEDAIPEIEQEANDLLARLTDNQASLSIESLRDLKKGGTRETLDINISDAQGIRPYELFSGGEAFRIDFALRIALSKLLARRAGTSLQTLIIDEGFGSQDDEGLTRMMDALYTIQDDFEKVIIVSHLDTMKEQFPVHFYIQKEPNGSKVTVIEHG